MLTAINLKHELSFKAHEIRNEWTEWNLAAEFDATQSWITEHAPERTLGVGHFSTQ